MLEQSMRKHRVEDTVLERQRIVTALPEFDVGNALRPGICRGCGNLIRTEIQPDHPAWRNVPRDITRNGAWTATTIQHADAGSQMREKKRAIGGQPAARHARRPGLAAARGVTFCHG